MKYNFIQYTGYKRPTSEHSLQRLEKYKEMIRNGHSMYSIAKVEGVSKQAINDFFKRIHFDYLSELEVRQLKEIKNV